MTSCGVVPAQITNCVPVGVQVLQLQSAATQPPSQPLDYKSGIEAMILAILQQTDVSLAAQQAQLLALQADYLSAQDNSAARAGLTSLYAAYLAEALVGNSSLTSAIQSIMRHLNSSSSLLPVSMHNQPLQRVSLCHCAKLSDDFESTSKLFRSVN